MLLGSVEIVRGANTITVTATDTAGTTASTSITVNAATTGDYIRLTSNIESGISPLEVTLRIDGSFSIDNSNLGVTGPAAIELLDNTSPDEYRIRMTAEGVYTFTAGTIGPDGNTYQDSVTVTVLNKSQLDALLKAKWEGMKEALTSGDIEKSLTHFVEGSKPRYRGIFTGMTSDRINAIFSSIVEMETDSVNDRSAECGAIRVELDGMYSYPVTFVKNENGIWMIMGF